MKKNKIIIGIIFIIGVCLMIIGSVISLSKTVKKEEEKLSYSDLKITSPSSLSFNVFNNSNQNIESVYVILYFLNEKEEVIMKIPMELTDIKAKSNKEFEYVSEYVFEEYPVRFYGEISAGEDDYENTNISDETKLGVEFRNIVSEVIEDNLLNENKNYHITMNDLEKIYNKNIDVLKTEKYGCNLNESYADVIIENDNYNIITYINCEAFVK